MSPNKPLTEPGPPVDFGGMLIAIVAMVALVLGTTALVTNDRSSVTTSEAASTGPTASLSEFAISPAPIVVEAGETLTVENDGSQFHNVKVRGTDVGTADLLGGETESIDLSSLDPGEYELFCDIAGHAEAGMTGTLRVLEPGEKPTEEAATSVEPHGTGEADWAAMDAAMTESMMAFPAVTEGVGNQPLEPDVLPDGTKRFELTAAIVQWEVAPGEFVDAWAYNGMVPGPWIKVEVGDRVQVQVDNQLPMGTDVHWHGVRTPNAQDGVAPYTQDLIPAGGTFLYEFTATDPAVGMYHAHHHGQMQVPNGLLGVIQIGDVDLPRGRTISGTPIPTDLEVAQEIPMVLNDAGVIGLSLNGKSFPATAPYAADVGDWLLIHYLNEGLTDHPMHLHQFPQLVVAKDGIPLDSPYYADTINIAPGERYSVLVRATEPGTWVWHCHILTHVESDEGMFGMVTALTVSS